MSRKIPLQISFDSTEKMKNLVTCSSDSSQLVESQTGTNAKSSERTDNLMKIDKELSRKIKSPAKRDRTSPQDNHCSAISGLNSCEKIRSPAKTGAQLFERFKSPAKTGASLSTPILQLSQLSPKCLVDKIRSTFVVLEYNSV